MTDSALSQPIGRRIAFFLAFVLVVVGMVNTMPEIPGLQDWARDITGRPFFRVSGFPPEYFYPPIFLLMMLIVALDASVYRAWRRERPKLAWLGLLLDIGLITAAFLGAFGYLVEIDSICLIDQITGERARLIQEAAERSAGVIPGISLDAEVPACQARCCSSTIWTMVPSRSTRYWQETSMSGSHKRSSEASALTMPV